MNVVYSLVSALIISLISLVGIFSLLTRKKLDKIVFFLVAFAAGTMIGGTFLHLLPESLEKFKSDYIFLCLILGFIAFFMLEKFIFWHHCHKENCEIHPFGILNLFGDSVHNFVDGVIIFAGFSHSLEFGITISLLILLHELPQELGDFGVLLFAGYNPFRALFLNFISALTSLCGVLFGYFVLSSIQNLSIFLMPFAGGGFLYISASDLIPELHREKEMKKSILAFVTFTIGIILMWILKITNIHF
jgi:zinc and cadmium transporter